MAGSTRSSRHHHNISKQKAKGNTCSFVRVQVVEEVAAAAGPTTAYQRTVAREAIASTGRLQHQAPPHHDHGDLRRPAIGAVLPRQPAIRAAATSPRRIPSLYNHHRPRRTRPPSLPSLHNLRLLLLWMARPPQGSTTSVA